MVAERLARSGGEVDVTSRQCHLCASTPCRCRVDYFAPLRQPADRTLLERLVAEQQRPTPRFKPGTPKRTQREAWKTIPHDFVDDGLTRGGRRRGCKLCGYYVEGHEFVPPRFDPQAARERAGEAV